jgi:hypothetical protein
MTKAVAQGYTVSMTEWSNEIIAKESVATAKAILKELNYD